MKGMLLGAGVVFALFGLIAGYAALAIWLDAAIEDTFYGVIAALALTALLFVIAAKLT